MGVTVGEAKEILGIAPEAKDAEIENLAKKAYRKLALKVGLDEFIVLGLAHCAAVAPR